jgi:hypothetical protein
MVCSYDVSDMRSRILAFANNSTNHASSCIKVVNKMKFKSEEDLEADTVVKTDDDRMVLFDVEVYPNLFVICWKYRGDDNVVRMINPSREEVEKLTRLKLVGFYNRRFDNHIIYAAMLGYSVEQLYDLTRKIVIDGNRNAFFAQAYNLSYADVWDFSTIKQSLKKFEIDLGIDHMELDIPLDQPVDEKDWPRIVEYCVNDVRATESVLEDRWEDFVARQILAELSGLTVNDTTQRHTAKIIFENDKNPQQYFVYTDLSEEFHGYKFDAGKSSYRGEDPGEGGYVYADPGSTNESPFWTWRVCIRPQSGYLIFLGSILIGLRPSSTPEWQLNVRTTRKPVPFIMADSPSFLTLLKVTPAVLRHWLSLSKS